MRVTLRSGAAWIAAARHKLFRRRARLPEQWIKMTTKRWAELLDLQRRQDEQR